MQKTSIQETSLFGIERVSMDELVKTGELVINSSGYYEIPKELTFSSEKIQFEKEKEKEKIKLSINNILNKNGN